MSAAPHDFQSDVVRRSQISTFLRLQSLVLFCFSGLLQSFHIPGPYSGSEAPLSSAFVNGKICMPLDPWMTDSGASDSFSAIGASYLSSCSVEDLEQVIFHIESLVLALLELGHIYLNHSHDLQLLARTSWLVFFPRKLGQSLLMDSIGPAFLIYQINFSSLFDVRVANGQ